MAYMEMQDQVHTKFTDKLIAALKLRMGIKPITTFMERFNNSDTPKAAVQEFQANTQSERGQHPRPACFDWVGPMVSSANTTATDVETGAFNDYTFVRDLSRAICLHLSVASTDDALDAYLPTRCESANPRPGNALACCCNHDNMLKKRLCYVLLALIVMGGATVVLYFLANADGPSSSSHTAH